MDRYDGQGRASHRRGSRARTVATPLIHFNAITPGGVATDVNSAHPVAGHLQVDMLRDFAAMTGTSVRHAAPEHVSTDQTVGTGPLCPRANRGTVRFLASDDSRYMTGGLVHAEGAGWRGSKEVSPRCCAGPSKHVISTIASGEQSRDPA
ncbi:Rossmann-fold NAD(P)-binding domain-containing protein [Rhodococcus wratislaviensis]|uniref:hypothetical protein n=1 Tax=Rhodococcus wratislaviensis TaxID=44752 RepID=UPI0036480AB7